MVEKRVRCVKVVQLNATCGEGSTGKICVAVSRLLSQRGHENYIFYSSGQSEYPLGISHMTSLEVKWNALRSRLIGNYGFHAKASTKRLLTHLKRIDPDVVHLHNIHGHDVDLGILIPYLKETHKKVFWTFHDCWAFTGYCPHFDMAQCGKWETTCEDCPQKAQYSWFFDRSQSLFEKKKTLLQDLDLTIITPSEWLAGLVKRSFLREYPVKVIRNGIDLSIFSPTDSDFRKRHGAEQKKIVLGVAFGWGERKGLDVFVELAKRLPEEYQIVLVGTTEQIDRQLPANILSIHRTQDPQELASIYSAADVFVNPTMEENYPTVNMEALACGTPVLTFDTGGSGEMLDNFCGAVVKKSDIDALEREILRVCKTKPYTREACLQRAQAFDQQACFEEYMTLYE